MENDTTSWVNLPNCLTFLRILLIPVFLITYYQLPDDRYISIIVFAAASFTDALDGYLARRLNQITSFGKLCDPLADKLMTLSMLFCLAGDGYLAFNEHRWLNWVLLLVVMVKELIMMVGALFMLKKGVVVFANIWGKCATVLFVMGIVSVYPWHEIVWLRECGRYIILAAVVMSMVALVSYITGSVKKLRAAKIH